METLWLTTARGLWDMNFSRVIPTNLSAVRAGRLLERAVGCNVWMITGTRDATARMIYRLVGRYTPSEIRDDDSDPDLHIIFGDTGSTLEPPPVLNDFDWFRELLQTQNKFSFGFNPVRGKRTLAGLRSVIQGAGATHPDRFTTNEGGTTRVTALFKSAIYVNASPDRLSAASRGSEPSLPITEKKRWTGGHKLLLEARSRGEELPLIFAHYAPLTFWALAREVILHESTTEYCFAELCPLNGYRRRDLVVESTGAPLPDEFIRSYALVHTPKFLSARSPGEVATPLLSPLIEGSASSVTVTSYERNPLARKRCLQRSR